MKIANLIIQIYDKGEWKTLNKNKFRFNIGEKVIFYFFSRKTKVKIVGYDGDNYVIKIDEENYLTAAKGQLSRLKRPDELEAGDKFKDILENKYKVIAVDYDDRFDHVSYFVKKINSNLKGMITTKKPNTIKEIIYD